MASVQGEEDRSNDGPRPPPSAPLPTNTSNYETVFTNHKAGMEGADLNKIKHTVYEMSKDSAHFQNEQRKMTQTQQKIDKMRKIAASLTPGDLVARAASVNHQIADLEATRDLTRTWIHVDMDAFFAAVEERDNPSLQGRPFAVGDIGMISTASYAARKFGVRSAMPGFIALKLCPHLLFVPCNFAKYRAASQQTRAVFARYDPHFEAAGLDEVYLDVTECLQNRIKNTDNYDSSTIEVQYHAACELAAEIRGAVGEATGGLTASCGVAPNRTLAKICSDINKPNGQSVLRPTKEAVDAFVGALPVRKMPGIGRVTEHVLRAFGIVNCSDIIPNRGLLSALFSPTSLDFFLQCGMGVGATLHAPQPSPGDVGRKGISAERTFRPISARADLEAKLAEIAKKLGEEMQKERLQARTVTLKIKLTTFEVRTRAVTLPRYISKEQDIVQAGVKLLRAEYPVEIRLMGLRMSHFYEEPKREAGQRSLRDVLDTVADRDKKKEERNTNTVEEVEEEGKRVLSLGEEVELTLRAWGEEEEEEEEELEEDEENEEKYDGRRKQNTMPLHLPPTPLDDVVIRKKSQTRNLAELTTNETKNKRKKDVSLWSCEVCTFENPKGSLLCEMCGTTKAGTRWSNADGGSGGNRNGKQQAQNKKKKKSDGTVSGMSVVDLFKEKNKNHHSKATT